MSPLLHCVYLFDNCSFLDEMKPGFRCSSHIDLSIRISSNHHPYPVLIAHHITMHCMQGAIAPAHERSRAQCHYNLNRIVA